MTFAEVLAEACRRMCADHEGKSAGAAWYADRAERRDTRFWRAIARQDRTEAREQSELAQVYRWYAQLLGGLGPGACSCRLPRYCPHVPDGRYW